MPPGEKDERYDEDDFGTRHEGMKSEPKEWIENEVVLMPLGALRGVTDVRIEGMVTEKWALWLGCGMSKMGEEVEEFEFRPRAREAIAKLRSDG